MQLTNIGKNKAMITHKVWHESKEFTTDFDVYFSYSQPVVVVDWNKRTVYKNDTRYSNTTSRHVKEFLRLTNRFDDGIIIDRWQLMNVDEVTINELSQGPGGQHARLQ
jgi:hypothetical protein